jgi:hypothetical protein
MAFQLLATNRRLKLGLQLTRSNNQKHTFRTAIDNARDCIDEELNPMPTSQRTDKPYDYRIWGDPQLGSNPLARIIILNKMVGIHGVGGHQNALRLDLTILHTGPEWFRNDTDQQTVS